MPENGQTNWPASFLGETSTFIFYPAFESGVIKLLKVETELTETEKLWLSCFKKEVVELDQDSEAENEPVD